MEDAKICSCCGKEKPFTIEFFRHQRRQCRECERVKGKEWRESHKEHRRAYHSKYCKDHPEKFKVYNNNWRKKNYERYLEYSRIYCRTHPPTEEQRECRKNRMKIYRQKNKERDAAYHREYYIKNRERSKITHKKWEEENHDKLIATRQRRRARVRKLASTLTTEQWKDIKVSFDNKCAYCGKEKPLTQEHFIPVDSNGEYSHNNIIPACKSCNCSKGNKDFFQWYPKYKHYSKVREQKILRFLGYNNRIQQLSLI